MKISPITKNRFVNFTSKVKHVYRGTISADLAREIDVFEETHSNAKELGSGLFAKAYILNGTNCVIKESLPTAQALKQNREFFPEAKALEYLPSSVRNTQRLIAHVQTEKGNPYLISTFVEGTPARYPEHPWDKNSFDGLFETLLSLDKAGIYHNDINQANCLIDKNYKASTIDYQFAETFKLDERYINSKKFKNGQRMMPSNAQMFEMASLPWYIRTMSKTAPKEEVRELFRTYLESKSQYAKQRAIYLLQLLDPNYGDMTRYELLQAKFLTNPTEEMVDLQAKKLQLLYSFRKTFSVVDPNSNYDKNIGSAIQSYIYTMAAARDMEAYAHYLSFLTRDENLKEFLSYERDFAKFWYNTMEEELGLDKEDGVFPWLERNAQLKPKHTYRTEYEFDMSYGPYTYQVDLGVDEEEDLSKNFEAAEHIPPENIDDIASIIITDREADGIPVLDPAKKEEIMTLAERLENKITQNSESKPNIINNEIMNYLTKKHKFVNNSKAVIAQAKKGNFNALIASAILAQYQKNIASEALKNISSKYNLETTFIQKQKALLSGDLNLDILKKSARMLIECISYSNRPNMLIDKSFLRFI